MYDLHRFETLQMSLYSAYILRVLHVHVHVYLAFFRFFSRIEKHLSEIMYTGSLCLQNYFNQLYFCSGGKI